MSRLGAVPASGALGGKPGRRSGLGEGTVEKERHVPPATSPPLPPATSPAGAGLSGRTMGTTPQPTGTSGPSALPIVVFKAAEARPAPPWASPTGTL